MRAAALIHAVMLAGCCMGGSAPTAPSLAPPIAPPSVAPVEALWPAEGTIVLANWHELGRYYLGVVVANTGAHARVLYADGDSELLPLAMAVPDRLAPGLRVEVYDGTDYVPATLERRVGHALAVALPDEERQWVSVALVRIAPDEIPETGPTAAPLPPVAHGEVGSIVLARYSDDGYWYEAVIAERDESDLRRVVYCDGSGEDLPMASIRPAGITVGSRVEVREHDGESWETAIVLGRVGHAVEVEQGGDAHHWVGLTDVRVDQQ